MTTAAEAMKKLREERRAKGLCAVCGEVPSDTYKCAKCSGPKKLRKRRIGNQRVWEVVEPYLLNNDVNIVELAALISDSMEEGKQISGRNLEQWIANENVMPKTENATAFARFFGQKIRYFWPDHPDELEDEESEYIGGSSIDLFRDPITLLDLKKNYPRPANDLLAIQSIISTIEQHLKIQLNAIEISSVIEYFQCSKVASPNDAYYWFLEATFKTARRPSKSSLNFLIGIIKNWLEHGHGHYFSLAHEQTVSLFEKSFGLSISKVHHPFVSALINQYGAVRVAEAISTFSTDDVVQGVLNQIQERIRSKIEAEQSITETPVTQPNTGENPRSELVDAEEEDSSPTINEIVVTSNDNITGSVYYTFERKLKGGIAKKTGETDVYVPETIIRKLDIEHGDKLDVTNISRQGDGSLHAQFRKVEGFNEPHPNRIQISFAIVDRDDSTWFAEYYQSGSRRNSIKIDETPYRILIKYDDLREYQLSEGDLVDIAFWENDPTTSRVIWKHRL